MPILYPPSSCPCSHPSPPPQTSIPPPSPCSLVLVPRLVVQYTHATEEGDATASEEAGVPESLSRKMALLGPIPIPPMSPPGIALLGGLRPQSCVHGKKWQKPVVSV